MNHEDSALLNLAVITFIFIQVLRFNEILDRGQMARLNTKTRIFNEIFLIFSYALCNFLWFFFFFDRDQAVRTSIVQKQVIRPKNK